MTDITVELEDRVTNLRPLVCIALRCDENGYWKRALWIESDDDAKNEEYLLAAQDRIIEDFINEAKN